MWRLKEHLKRKLTLNFRYYLWKWVFFLLNCQLWIYFPETIIDLSGVLLLPDQIQRMEKVNIYKYMRSLVVFWSAFFLSVPLIILAVSSFERIKRKYFMTIISKAIFLSIIFSHFHFFFFTNQTKFRLRKNRVWEYFFVIFFSLLQQQPFLSQKLLFFWYRYFPKNLMLAWA